MAVGSCFSTDAWKELNQSSCIMRCPNKTYVACTCTMFAVQHVLTIFFDSMCAFPAGVRWDPVDLHSDEGVQSFAAPREGKVGPTDHLQSHAGGVKE